MTRKYLPICVLIFLCLFITQSLWAATIQVNTQADLFMDASACSLRDAIETFNNAAPSGGCTNSSSNSFGTNDTILLPAGQYDLTLSGPPNDDNSSGDLDIEPTVTAPLTILGADPDNPSATVIDGGALNPRDRVLHIVGMFPVTTLTPVILNGVTIQNGWAPDGTGGGGIAVNVSGCLDLLNSVIRMNRAGDGEVTGGQGGNGGGIYFGNTTGLCDLNIVGSLIENNQAGNGTPSANLLPGGGGDGGGIYVVASTFNMDQTTIRYNQAGNGAENAGFDIFDTFGGFGGSGGGLYLFSFGDTATITHSTFNNNVAGNGGDATSAMTLGGGFGGNGGGLYFESAFSLTTFTLANSTFSENVAGNGGNSTFTPGGKGGLGGGISISPPIMSDDLTANLNNNTISANTAGLGGSGTMPGADGDGGGLAIFNDLQQGSSISIANSIFANNTVATTGMGPNCSGIFFTDNGFNLETGTDCMFTLPSDKQNAEPMLGPLQDNGGPTFTHALLLGSAALDAGNNTADPSSGFPACEADDQRLVSRPQGSACDIGAYETQVADLSVSKSISSDPVEEGATVQFSITITNNGPDDANFILLEDVLPAEIHLISATSDQGDCLEINGIVQCELDIIPAAGTALVVIEAIFDNSGNYTNTASVSFPGIDSDDTNNTDSINFTVNPASEKFLEGGGCALSTGRGHTKPAYLLVLSCALIATLRLGQIRRRTRFFA